jgi:hypothetical protein
MFQLHLSMINIYINTQLARFDWLAKTNDITPGCNVCWLRFSWLGRWLAVPRGESVSLLPRGSWDPPRVLSSTSLMEKENFTATAWKRDDSLLIAGTNKVCTYSRSGVYKDFDPYR